MKCYYILKNYIPSCIKFSDTFAGKQGNVVLRFTYSVTLLLSSANYSSSTKTLIKVFPFCLANIALSSVGTSLPIKSTLFPINTLVGPGFMMARPLDVSQAQSVL